MAVKSYDLSKKCELFKIQGYYVKCNRHKLLCYNKCFFNQKYLIFEKYVK